MTSQDNNVSQTSKLLSPEKKYDPDNISSYIKNHVGISRKELNVKAFIGIFIFGWLMKINYDDLGEKGFGWSFLVVLAIVYAIGKQVEPMIFAVAPVIYVAAWVHTNVLLTRKQRIAEREYFNEYELAEKSNQANKADIKARPTN
jgi:hypothetical protein